MINHITKSQRSELEKLVKLLTELKTNPNADCEIGDIKYFTDELGNIYVRYLYNSLTTCNANVYMNLMIIPSGRRIVLNDTMSVGEIETLFSLLNPIEENE